MLYLILSIPLYLAVQVTVSNCALQVGQVDPYTMALNEKPQDLAPSDFCEEFTADQKSGLGGLASKLIGTVAGSRQKLSGLVISSSEKLAQNLHNTLSRAGLDETSGADSGPPVFNKLLWDVLHDLTRSAQTLRDSLVDALKLQDIEFLTEQLSNQIEIIKEHLAVEFPDPITQLTDPQKREVQRAGILNRIFSDVEKFVISVVARELGSFEQHIIREHFHLFSSHATHFLLVLVNMIEENPLIAKIASEFILHIIFTLIVPQGWIIRLLLPLLGFSKLGPVKGSFAAWAQSHFWGSAVEAGSWFAKLQSKAMV